MKLLTKLFLGIIIVLVLLVVCRNYILKSAVEGGARFATGLKLDIANLDLGASKIAIRDMKLYNPGGFTDPIMVNIPEIYADYELADFLKGAVHLTEVRFHLEEIMIVKNKEGKVNIDSLKQIQQLKMPEGKPEDKPVKIQIDNLSLHIERVVYKDYSAPDGEVVVKSFDVGLKEEVKDIKDLNVVISMIMFKALSKASIAAMANIDLGGLGAMAEGTLKNTTEAATAILGQTGETTKETITNTAEGLKNILKKPFGDK